MQPPRAHHELPLALMIYYERQLAFMMYHELPLPLMMYHELPLALDLRVLPHSALSSLSAAALMHSRGVIISASAENKRKRV